MRSGEQRPGNVYLYAFSTITEQTCIAIERAIGVNYPFPNLSFPTPAYDHLKWLLRQTDWWLLYSSPSEGAL